MDGFGDTYEYGVYCEAILFLNHMFGRLQTPLVWLWNNGRCKLDANGEAKMRKVVCHPSKSAAILPSRGLA